MTDEIVNYRGEPTLPRRSAAEAMIRWRRFAGGLSAALLILAGLLTVLHLLPAIAWAVVIAIGLWPLFQRAAARWPRQRRGLLPGLVVVAVLMVFVLPLTMIGIPALHDSHAVRWVEQARTSGVAPPTFLQRLPYGAELTQYWQANFAKPGAISAVAGHMTQGGVLEIGRRFGAAAIHRLVLVGLMLLTLFFLLRDADGVVDQLRIAGRRAIGPTGERVAQQVIRSVRGTINGLVLVGLAEGLTLGVAYWTAGVPHAALFGLFTALLAMVPFGAALAIAAAALVLLAGDHLVAATVIAAFGLMVIFVADHFVRPLLIGGAARLPFLWVLLGILGGVETWGLVGLFVGPALLSALLLLWREYVGRPEGPLGATAEH